MIAEEEVQSKGIEERPILQLLLICDDRSDIASTVRAHISAIVKYSRHRVLTVSSAIAFPERVDLSRFDVIVLHYSVFGSLSTLPSDSIARLRNASALKVVYVQDEHRNVQARVEMLRALGADVLFTCVPTKSIPEVYGEDVLPGMNVKNTLTGYVDNALLERSAPDWHARPIDVGYRGRRLPIWLGRLGQEKSEIALTFQKNASKYGLVCDISVDEEAREYGNSWIRFLQSCKAVLGTESGASCVDRDGTIQRAVEKHIEENAETSTEELYRLYVESFDGNIELNQISPRCFEAAALRTLMILHPGEYSGVLVPWQHYIPLAKDQSNMDMVVKALFDEALCKKIIERAYTEVAGNPKYSFKVVAEELDAAIDESFCKQHRCSKAPYHSKRFADDAKPSILELKYRMMRWIREKSARIIFGKILRHMSPEKRGVYKQSLKRYMSWSSGASRKENI